MVKVHTRQSLEALKQRVADAVADHELSPEERKAIVNAFDLSNNGLTTDDFNGMPAQQFNELRSILLSHGMDIVNDTLSQSVRIKDFRSYHPTASTQQHSIPNPFIEQYFTQQSNANQLTVSDWANAAPKEVPIADMQKFTADILAAAQELGYSEAQIRKLSIHDAVLLAGQLTAHRLAYHHGMISEAEKALDAELKSDPQSALEKMMRGERPESNAEAIRIDNMPPDQVFAQKQGICRNYAVVNAAVFSALKRLNPNLRNTHMTTYSPESLGHGYALPHAWNMVTTIGPKFLDVTYVDPTWLDTRSRTTFNDQAATDAVGATHKAFYNAVDTAHFGKHLQYIDLYMATMHEAFVQAQSSGGKALAFWTARPIVQDHRRRAFSYRSRYISKRISTPLKDITPKQRADALSNTANEIPKLIFDAMQYPTGIAMLQDYGIEHNPLMDGMESQLRTVYNEILTKRPALLDQNISYQTEGAEGRTVLAQTTLRELFAIVLPTESQHN